MLDQLQIRQRQLSHLRFGKSIERSRHCRNWKQSLANMTMIAQPPKPARRRGRRGNCIVSSGPIPLLLSARFPTPSPPTDATTSAHRFVPLMERQASAWNTIGMDWSIEDRSALREHVTRLQNLRGIETAKQGSRHSTYSANARTDGKNQSHVSMLRKSGWEGFHRSRIVASIVHRGNSDRNSWSIAREIAGE